MCVQAFRDSGVFQKHPQLFQGSIKAGLHRAQRQSGDGGNLPQGQLLSVTKQNKFPLVFLQTGESRCKKLSVFGSLIAGFRPADNVVRLF